MSQQLASDPPKRTPELLFQATLHHVAEVVEATLGGGRRSRVTVRIGDHLVPLAPTPKMHTQMQRELPGGLQKLTIYPRTDALGVLDSGTALARSTQAATTAVREYPLQVLGRLVRVDRGEGLIVMRIYPNRGARGGQVFHLSLLASLELIDGLPEPGRGLFVQGALRPRSLRLVALKATATKLPPRARPEPDGAVREA